MTEDGERDLHRLVVRGVGWMAASQVTAQVLGLATSIVVARALGPFEVGLAAEALVFADLALVAVDFGFGSAVIQRPMLTEQDKSTAFWMGTILGVSMMLIGVALSWPIASLYGQPRVQPLFAVLSLAFLFTAPGVVQGALLARELRFRSLQVRNIMATVVSCAVAVALALAGAGPWTIVVQTLVIAGTSTVLLWRASPWRPKAAFSMRSLRNMAGYAGHVTGSKIVDWGTTNLDNFLVGRSLGAFQLGAYSIAYSTSVTLVERVAHPATQVFFPAFSRMREHSRIASAWLRATRMLAFVVIPAMLGMVVVAPDFVHVVFGPKWRSAATVIQILAPVGMLQSLTALNLGVLQAVAQTRTLFRFSIALAVATIGAFVAGLPWGIDGVATAYLIATLVMQPIFTWLTTRAVGLTLWDWGRSMQGVIEASCVMVAVVLAARLLFVGAGIGATIRLVLLVVVGATVYLSLVHWLEPEVGSELRTAWQRRRQSPESTGLERP